MQVIRTENVNTNNGWGFGGKLGKNYYYDNGLIEFKGKYCYRHMGTSKAHTWYVTTPDGDYTEIRGEKSETVYLYKIVLELEKKYTMYEASFINDFYEYWKESNPTTIELIKTIECKPLKY